MIKYVFATILLIHVFISNAQDKSQYKDNSKELIRVKIDDKYGLFDNTGKEILPIVYDLIEPIKNSNEIKLWLNHKAGFVNKEGKVIIPIVYEYIEDFEEDLAIVFIKGNYGFIDKENNLRVPAIYSSVEQFSEGLSKVEVNEKYGYIDKENRQIIPLKYVDAESFSEGLAKVKIKDKYGYINKSDNLVISAKYSNAESFWQGIALVEINGKYGAINKKGKIVTPLEYDSLEQALILSDYDESKEISTIFLGENEAFPEKIDNKWGFSNIKGKKNETFKYDAVTYFYKGYACVGYLKSNSDERLTEILWGIMDDKLEEIVPPKYLKIGVFSEGKARVEFGKGGCKLFGSDDNKIVDQIPGKWGFIDHTGKEVITPKYNYANNFSEGLAAVFIDNDFQRGWGFIDEMDRVVIPNIYEIVSNFKNGTALVSLNNKWGKIDKLGNIVLPIKYDWIDGASENLSEYTSDSLFYQTDNLLGQEVYK